MISSAFYWLQNKPRFQENGYTRVGYIGRYDLLGEKRPCLVSSMRAENLSTLFTIVFPFSRTVPGSYKLLNICIGIIEERDG